MSNNYHLTMILQCRTILRLLLEAKTQENP